MPTVQDPAGREWLVDETGLGRSDALHFEPGNQAPAFTLSILRVSSGNESFFVSVRRDWRELSNEALWELLSQARERGDRQG